MCISASSTCDACSAAVSLLGFCFTYHLGLLPSAEAVNIACQRTSGAVFASAAQLLIQEEADPGQVLVEASTLPVTQDPPNLPVGSSMSPLSRGRQEGLGGEGKYNSLRLSSSIANTATTVTPCSSTAVSITKGILAGAGAGPGA